MITDTLKKLGLSPYINKKRAELLRAFFDEKNIETVYHKVSKYKIPYGDTTRNV